MTRVGRRLLCAGLAALTVGAAAAELKAFVPGSLQEITAARRGQPFVLALWSLSCTHCAGELRELARLRREGLAPEVVTLCTDTPDAAPAAGARLDQLGLGNVEAWGFADPFTERLRFEVDPQWYGELPRTYLYRRDGTRQAVSGKLDAATLKRWLAAPAR
jgi:hypothetical protein